MSLWFEKIIVRFFMSIDSVLFNFIATLYDLLIAISRTSILTQGDIASFAARIELLLGIFMLFKVSFSLITYIVNPDDFSDTSKGFGKLIKNSVISLVLLVLVPYIFQMAFNLQAKILDDNILAKLLLGEKINNAENDDESGDGNSTNYKSTILDSAGNTMAFYVMLPFFSPNYAVEGLSSCLIMVNDDGTFNQECRDALKDAGLDDYSLDNYTYGVENRSLGLTFRAKTAITLTNEAEDDGEEADQHFVIAYQKPLSTVTAVVVCLMLISFCIDVGVRSVKLAFLQLIYPVPVISYMDPKSGQDGMFSKWYKMCLSTFLSLFIRLLALYFGIYIITKVSDFGMYDIINGSQVTNGWVKIFIIVGVLMFIKQLPKILENMGFKLEGDGKFNLNPLKKIEEGAVGGGLLKKPNEMLAKAGKGIAHAPLGFASTMGRKTLAGIDSKKNGRGWRAGWSSQHGKLYDSYRKKKDEWMPYDAERHKSKTEGRNEFDRQHKLWAQGRNAWEKVGGKYVTDENGNYIDENGNITNDKSKRVEKFNGSNSEYYNSVYSNKGFVGTKMYLDRVSAAAKKAETEYNSLDVNADSAEREEKYKNYIKATKAKEKAQKDHDIMRKRYVEDAEIEDALDYTDSKVDYLANNEITEVSRDATSIHRKRNYDLRMNRRGNDRNNNP